MMASHRRHGPGSGMCCQGKGYSVPIYMVVSSRKLSSRFPDTPLLASSPGWRPSTSIEASTEVGAVEIPAWVARPVNIQYPS